MAETLGLAVRNAVGMHQPLEAGNLDARFEPLGYHQLEDVPTAAEGFALCVAYIAAVSGMTNHCRMSVPIRRRQRPFKFRAQGRV